MNILHSKDYIANKCGVFTEVASDIYSTPFWTPEYCAALIKELDSRPELFYAHNPDGYSASELNLYNLSRIFSIDICKQIMDKCLPSLLYVFPLLNILGFTSPYFVRYGPNDVKNMKLHHDVSLVSMLVKLNDDFTGGDLVFPRQDYNNKNLPVGHALFWPGQVTHPHQVLDITSGTKFSLTVWAWHVPWTSEYGIAVEELK